MRLGIQILNTSASLNSFKTMPFVRVARGENLDIFFRLVDIDQGELRYVPPVDSTVKFNIPRLSQIQPAQNNTRTTVDYSIDREAINPFEDDRSIWKVTILPSETVNFISNSIRVTLIEEDGTTRIAWAPESIKVIDGQSS